MADEAADADDPEEYERDLGTAALILAERGHQQAAALLLDARLVGCVYIDAAFEMGGERVWDVVEAILEAPTWMLPRFEGAPTMQIREALNEVLESHGIHIKDVTIRAEPAGKDWRSALHKQLGGGVTNQARLVASDALPAFDRMRFRSQEELRVYKAFKRAQAALPPRDTLTIAVNPCLRVPTNTWEPDLLIFFRGRVGNVEVDGPSHAGKRSRDASRDRVLRHAGIAEVDHIDVADTHDDAELDEFVKRFLHRLGAQ